MFDFNHRKNYFFISEKLSILICSLGRGTLVGIVIFYYFFEVTCDEKIAKNRIFVHLFEKIELFFNFLIIKKYLKIER